MPSLQDHAVPYSPTPSFCLHPVIRFPSSLRIPFSHPLNGRTYHLVSCDQIAPTPEHLQRITRIANEPAIYDLLFKDRLQGQPYPVEKAVEWLTWSTQGWRDGTHFSFAVTDESGAVAAACDIKSADPDGGEIGYWSSLHHTGVMTSAVQLMCAEAKRAGFRTLTARIHKGNVRSRAVLRRVGFDETDLPDDGIYDHFVMPLNHRTTTPSST